MPAFRQQLTVVVRVSLVFLLALLFLACGEGDSAEVLETGQEGIDASVYGTAGDDIVNLNGDVASVMGVAPGDFAQGEVKTGVAIYRSDGSRTVVDLPDGQTPSSWGAVGDDFVVIVYPCSKPKNPEQDCEETNREATNAYLIGSNDKLQEVANPPPYVGRQVLNEESLAVWQADNTLVTFDGNLNSWTTRTVDGPTYTPTLTCPSIGLQVSSMISSNDTGVITSNGEQTLVATTPITIEKVADLPPSRDGLAPRPVACDDDGVVIQVDGQLQTLSGKGSVLRSVSLPADMTGPGWECLPIVGTMPATTCAQYGAEGPTNGRLLLDAGRSTQSVQPIPTSNTSPRAVIPLPQETLGVLGQDAQIEEIQQ